MVLRAHPVQKDTVCCGWKERAGQSTLLEGQGHLFSVRSQRNRAGSACVVVHGAICRIFFLAQVLSLYSISPSFGRNLSENSGEFPTFRLCGKMESEPRAFLFSVTILLPFNQKTFLSPLRFDVLRWCKCISFRWGWRYGVALRRRFVRAVKELGVQEIQNKMVQTEDVDRFLCCVWSRQQIQTFRGNVLCAFGLLHWRFAMDPTSRLSFIWQERHLKTEWKTELKRFV